MIGEEINGAFTDLGASSIESVEHVYKNVSGALPDIQNCVWVCHSTW